MSKDSRSTRNIMSNIGYYLVVDMSNQMDSNLINKIIDIISDMLAVACSSRGVARIPFFGLAVINLQFDVVWKLSPLKGNYLKIIKSFASLKKISLTGNLSEVEFLDYLHMGLKQILLDINDLDCTKNRCEEMTEGKVKANVVLLTRKDGFPIKHYLDTLTPQLDFNKLQSIQIVELTKNVLYNNVQQGSLQLIQISSDVGLETFLKSWLVDLKFDREDLIIKFCDHELKCDIYEILFNTGLIPFSNSFHIQKEITNSSTSYLPDPVMPVYRLEVVERISSSGISESCVFGFPVQLRPTHKVDSNQTSKVIDDVDPNTEKFAALCKILYEADEYLIARLVCEDAPCGYFILMPGDCMFLVKSIASRELMLPTVSSYEKNKVIDYELRLEMSNSVFSLPLSDEYDPHRFDSNICHSLKRQLTSRNSGRSDGSGLNNALLKSNSFIQFKLKRKSSLEAANTSANKKQNKTNKLKLLDHLATLNK